MSRISGPNKPNRPPPVMGQRRDPKTLLHPRKVRSGIKLKSDEDSRRSNWAASRWIRMIEQTAGGPALKDGLEYATLGQTRILEFKPGAVVAQVQGRAYKPYEITLKIDTFDERLWERLISVMAEEALYAAKLLLGELPPTIEDIVAPLNAQLFPSEASQVTPSCTCKEEDRPWCKHVVCVALLVAEKLAEDPFVVFTLRGMPGDDLLERLRQRRAISGASGHVPVYTPRLDAISDAPAPPLEECVNNFWLAPTPTADIDLPVSKPEIDKPILRRLGPSPFTGSSFPLVGLLATCYDLIAEHARNEDPGDLPSEITDEQSPAHEPDPAPEPDSPPAAVDRKALFKPKAMGKAKAKPARAKPKGDA